MTRTLRSACLLFLLIIGFNTFAQKECHTAELQKAWFEKHPELHEKFLQYRQHLVELDRARLTNGEGSQGQKPSSTSIYTIPVVFHILHTGGNENISDAQVTDAVNILTRDFNKLNADTASVVAAFKNNIGDAKIAFRLATKDPLGNCTNGIIRHWAPITHNWSGDFSDYIYSWPSNQYLNIYVVRNITFPAAGYTYLPGSGVPPSVDAIVVLSGYVGSIGTSNPGLSRVLTHEVGHWLNLEHTWGWNSVGTTCGDDGVSDTPVTKGFTSCSLGNAAICNSGIVENVQNYMDYAYCENMFTSGQASWMQNTFTIPFFDRDFLSDPQNLAATGITNPGINCLPFVDIQSVPGRTICSGRTLTLKSFTWNAVPSSYLWGAAGSAVVNSPSTASTTILFTAPGTVTVSCLASNANGSDVESMVITVLDGNTDVTGNSTESFENNSVTLPANWTIINPTTPTQKWTISTLDGMNGTKCMFVPGEDLDPGTIEILESPSYDFKNNPGAFFTFKCAYARFSTQHYDYIKVQATKNCGSSWNDIWVPGVSGLAQGSGGISNVLYHPAANEWKTVDITNHPNFGSFKTEQNVRFRFFFQEDSLGIGHGNRFYLDDIFFAAPVGVNELSRSIALQLSPNPSNGNFAVDFELSDPSRIGWTLIDARGAMLAEAKETSYGTGAQHLEINCADKLAPGIYFLNLNVNGVKLPKKLVVE